jgi:3-dehydroquinate synthase
MMNIPRQIRQQITVTWDFPVVFTRDVFAPENPVLAETIDRLAERRRHRAIVFVDDRVALANRDLLPRISQYFEAHADHLELVGAPEIVVGGEPSKNDFLLIERFLTLLLKQRMDRQSFVIIVGGGAVMDAVGLAASLVHRGLRQIRIPTTVLGQNDAGVGLKNGMNYLGGKNAIGTFAPPFAVLNDFNFLRTLPLRDWLCGVAEAFKVAIIRDRFFFFRLCDHASKIPARELAVMELLIVRCAEIHLEHIATNGDPFESGRARPLDFGHWSAHKLELISRFRISHGQAVAAGVLLDSIYARLHGWLSPEELAQIHRGLRQSGFTLWFEEFDERNPLGERLIFEGLRDFQEHLGGELTVTFPLTIGSRHEVHEIDLAKMETALQELKGLAAAQ